MPSDEENVKYLYTVLTAAGPPSIDWAAVGAALDLKQTAVTKRWSRLKQSMVKGNPPATAYPFLWLCLKHSTREKAPDWNDIAKQCNTTAGAASKRFSRMKAAFDAGAPVPTLTDENAGGKRKRAPATKRDEENHKGEGEGEGEADSAHEQVDDMPQPKKAAPKKRAPAKKKAAENVQQEEAGSDNDNNLEVPIHPDTHADNDAESKLKKAAPKKRATAKKKAADKGKEGETGSDNDRKAEVPIHSDNDAAPPKKRARVTKPKPKPVTKKPAVKKPDAAAGKGKGKGMKVKKEEIDDNVPDNDNESDKASRTSEWVKMTMSDPDDLKLEQEDEIQSDS